MYYIFTNVDIGAFQSGKQTKQCQSTEYRAFWTWKVPKYFRTSSEDGGITMKAPVRYIVFADTGHLKKVLEHLGGLPLSTTFVFLNCHNASLKVRKTLR